ncbi:MAG TPA: DUF4363 family protein [Clostridia bacterium]
MKRTIIAILVFGILIGASIWEMHYLVDKIEVLKSGITDIYAYMEQDKQNIDTELNKKLIDDLEKQWDKDKIVMHAILPHSQLNELSYKINALNRHINQNDYNMANTAASAIIKNCEMILSNFLPKIENIL